MPKHDPRIDAYILKSAEFARPILEHIRALVHRACPGATETVKWGMPFFEYEGAILCNMAAFKQHCSLGFWKAPLMKDPNKLFVSVGETSMGHFGKITSLKDLPSAKVLTAYIKEAAKLNEEGVKALPTRKIGKEPADRNAAKTLDVPADIQKAINKIKEAKKTFEAFSYSNKKDYVEWITEAKTDETRKKRLDTAVEWMSEGKTRHWKYKK
jgi:uncharacterized protein YdeI (YjbR/CyaY-like superfamily)